MTHDEIRESILQIAESNRGLFDEPSPAPAKEPVSGDAATRVWRELDAAGDLPHGRDPMFSHALRAVSQGLAAPKNEDELRARLLAAEQLAATTELVGRAASAETQLRDTDRESLLRDALDALDLDETSAAASAKALWDERDMEGLRHFYAEWESRDPLAAARWATHTTEREETRAMLEENIAAIREREQELEKAKEVAGWIAQREAEIGASDEARAYIANATGHGILPEDADEAAAMVDIAEATAHDTRTFQTHDALRRSIFEEAAMFSPERDQIIEDYNKGRANRNLVVSPSLPPPSDEEIRKAIMDEVKTSSDFAKEVEGVATKAVAREKAEDE